jgi:hypothetical protein
MAKAGQVAHCPNLPALNNVSAHIPPANTHTSMRTWRYPPVTCCA